MSTLQVMAVFVVVWVIIGISAVVYFLGRQGYRDWRWYLIGGILGLLFVPIAAERARRETAVLERTSTAASSTTESTGGITALVGIDGSAESDEAVRTVDRLLAGSVHRVVLVAVVEAEAGEFADEDRQRQHRELLTERSRWLAESTTPVLEIASGQPARVLLDIARTEQVDILVVGRRGKGLSRRVLGSVADHLVKHATQPVLLAAPASRSPHG